MSSMQNALLAAGLAKWAPRSPDTLQPKFFGGVIPVASGKMGVLVFDAHASEVPEGIKIMGLTGGTPSTPLADARDRARWVKLDLESFLATASVVSMSVVGEEDGFCRIYVNYEADESRLGFNSWSGSSYEQLVRTLASKVYEKATVFYGNKMRVVLTGRRSENRPPDLGFYFERA